MNDQLKEKTKEAASDYGHMSCPVDFRARLSAMKGFQQGANWLYNQGYRFTEEDMRAAWKAGMSHEFGDSSFEEWLEERRKGQ